MAQRPGSQDTNVLVLMWHDGPGFTIAAVFVPGDCVRWRVIFDCLCLSLTTVSTPKAGHQHNGTCGNLCGMMDLDYVIFVQCDSYPVPKSA